MRQEFTSTSPVFIDSGPPDTVRSELNVTGLGAATVEEVEVTVNIIHSWVGDLEIRLIAPDGTAVVLVRRRGGSSDDFDGTIFRQAAATPIGDGIAPFRGTFRPEGDLADFDGKPAEGIWALEVEDHAAFDGGALSSWTLGLTTDTVATAPFHVDVRFIGGLTPTQQLAFATAAARWSEVIVGDVPPATVEGETIDDVLIEAQGVPIDGVGGVLGQAGPRFIRPGSGIPIKGIMSFDTADLANMEADGSLEDVILHEMAHVLGFGTLWQHMNLIQGAGTVNPVFTGTNARREYGLLRGASDPTLGDNPSDVPVANTGGPGTRDGHWREAVFGDELLTGFLSGTTRPISAMSIACFEDMGYQVDYGAANPFALPSMLRIAELGLMGVRHAVDTCAIDRTTPIVVSPDALHNT